MNMLKIGVYILVFFSLLATATPSFSQPFYLAAMMAITAYLVTKETRSAVIAGIGGAVASIIYILTFYFGLGMLPYCLASLLIPISLLIAVGGVEEFRGLFEHNRTRIMLFSSLAGSFLFTLMITLPTENMDFLRAFFGFFTFILTPIPITLLMFIVRPTRMTTRFRRVRRRSGGGVIVGW